MINEDGEIIVPLIRTRYNYDTNAASDATGLKCEDPTRAQQQFKEECDINVILERFGVTGVLPQQVKTPLQEDFLEATTFQESLHVMMQAEDAFMKMSAQVRKRFDNDPALFVDYFSDERNREEAEKLGLVMKKEKPAPPEPMLVRMVQEDSGSGLAKT